MDSIGTPVIKIVLGGTLVAVELGIYGVLVVPEHSAKRSTTVKYRRWLLLAITDADP
jgi:hypothetical protein